jgi:hypothetical protein
MIIHLTIGSHGMACFRLLYVKAPNFVKFKIGEQNLLVLVGLSGVLMTSVITILYGSGNSRTRAAINICQGHSVSSEVKYLYYENCSFHFKDILLVKLSFYLI